MKSEADIKRIIVQKMKQAGGYARRIEDQYGVGMPDMILIPIDGPVFFCEVKLIHGPTFGPTPRQFVELKRLAISRYSVPCVMGFHTITEQYYLHPYAEKCRLEDSLFWKNNWSISGFLMSFYQRYTTCPTIVK